MSSAEYIDDPQQYNNGVVFHPSTEEYYCKCCIQVQCIICLYPLSFLNCICTSCRLLRNFDTNSWYHLVMQPLAGVNFLDSPWFYSCSDVIRFEVCTNLAQPAVPSPARDMCTWVSSTIGSGRTDGMIPMQSICTIMKFFTNFFDVFMMSHQSV